MKKFVAGLLCGAGLMLSVSVFAEGAIQQITADLTPDISVEVNGRKIILEHTPVNYDGSIYLPVREMAGVVNLSVDWDEATRTAKLGSGSKTGQGSASGSASIANPGTIEEPPQIIKNGNVYIGLTAWQNKSGAKVTIDYKKRTIVIEQSGYPIVTIDSNNENEYLIENSISYINAALVE